MPENNPMLEQLKAALENPHFAVLAEKVAQEMLGAPFKDSMNAHPDVATVEGRWLGTLKRLVCNTVLTTYNEVMAGRFSAAHWARAEAEMEPYHNQVQGFFYPDNPDEVLRDVIVDMEGVTDADGNPVTDPSVLPEAVKVQILEESGGNLRGKHVVRDLTLPAGDQIVWIERSGDIGGDPYDVVHPKMMRAIRERQISMTWTHYMWAVTSGAYNEEKADG